MQGTLRTAVIALLLALLAVQLTAAQPPIVRDDIQFSAGGPAPEPNNLRVLDRPGDDGSGLLVVFDLTPLPGQLLFIVPQVQVDGKWLKTEKTPLAIDAIP